MHTSRMTSVAIAVYGLIASASAQNPHFAYLYADDQCDWWSECWLSGSPNTGICFILHGYVYPPVYSSRL